MSNYSKKEKIVNYEDMSKKLLKALAQELNNLGYVGEDSLKKYFEENVGLDKGQLLTAMKWCWK